MTIPHNSGLLISTLALTFLVLSGCGNDASGGGGEEASLPTLTVTFEQHYPNELTRCGTYDDRRLALEDGAGTLLVPAVGFSASDPLPGPDNRFPTRCEFTAELTDVPHADIYQLVYIQSEQYRGGYRRSELEEANWHLTGGYDELIRSRG